MSKVITDLFYNWLKTNTTLADSSIEKYVGGIKTISNDMIRERVINQSLLNMEFEQLCQSSRKIFNNSFFINKNNKGNNMYSRSLKYFIDYKEPNEINSKKIQAPISNIPFQTKEVKYQSAAINNNISTNVVTESINNILFELEKNDNLGTLVTIQRNNKEETTEIIKVQANSNRKKYIERQIENFYNGIKGEELVIAYEENRLKELYLHEYVDIIKHVSASDNKKGYDILSYDINEYGEVYEIYISVKTTKLNELNPYYISQNEVETSKKLGSKYRIYRVCEITSEKPKIVIIDKKVTELNLTPSTYIVK